MILRLIVAPCNRSSLHRERKVFNHAIGSAKRLRNREVSISDHAFFQPFTQREGTRRPARAIPLVGRMTDRMRYILRAFSQNPQLAEKCINPLAVHHSDPAQPLLGCSEATGLLLARCSCNKMYKGRFSHTEARIMGRMDVK